MKRKGNGKCSVSESCMMDGREIELTTTIYVDIENWNILRQEIAGSSFSVDTIFITNSN